MTTSARSKSEAAASSAGAIPGGGDRDWTPRPQGGHSPSDEVPISSPEEAGQEGFPTRRGPFSLFRRFFGRLAEVLVPPGYVERYRPPAILVSWIVHLIVVLALALLGFRYSAQRGTVTDAITLVGPDSRVSQRAEVVIDNVADTAPPVPVQAVELRPVRQPDRSGTDPAETMRKVLSELGQRPAADAPPVSMSLFDAVDLQLASRFTATGVEGRAASRRRELALARGGTRQSEAAVERALAWLAEHQLPNGGWSLVHDRGRCNGRCSNPGSPDRFDPAATGLSLLAFLGAGYTHRDGKYRETVRKGIYFLLQVMEDTPYGGSFLYQSERGMYNHGIATFALCEAYQMTGDPDLRDPAQRAIAFTVAAQHYHGSWGYLPQQPGDLTISGWQVMALKSAQSAGLDFPENTVLRIDRFLQTQAAEDGVFFGYTGPGHNNVCTAIGNLVRLFLGTSHTDPRILASVEHFLRTGPSADDIYYNYYATLLLFHMGGEGWRQWNPRMRDFLISTQATQGHEGGSWYFENHFGRQGGRLYTTAMAAMTLEVYYRFAPLFQHADDAFQL